jgi:hypothetical protein
MCIVGVTVQKRNCDSFSIMFLNPNGEGCEFLKVKRFNFFTLGPNSPANPHAIITHHQRGKPMSNQRVELRSVLPADLNYVLKPSVGHQ